MHSFFLQSIGHRLDLDSVSSEVERTVASSQLISSVHWGAISTWLLHFMLPRHGGGQNPPAPVDVPEGYWRDQHLVYRAHGAFGCDRNAQETAGVRRSP